MSPCSAPGSVCELIQSSELHPSVHSFIIIIIIQRTLRFNIVYTWSFSMCMYMCACVLLFFSGSLEFKLHKTFSMQLKNRFLGLSLWSSGSVQSLSHVQFFATPCTTACQASLSITNSQSLLKLMSIESMMPSNRLILLPASPPTLNLSQHQGLFQCWNWSVNVESSRCLLCLVPLTVSLHNSSVPYNSLVRW